MKKRERNIIIIAFIVLFFGLMFTVKYGDRIDGVKKTETRVLRLLFESSGQEILTIDTCNVWTFYPHKDTLIFTIDILKEM